MLTGWRIGPVMRALWRARAELLVGGALLAAWALLTLGVARLVGAYAPRAAGAVWPLGLGLLGLGIAGVRFIGTLASEGLYTLTRPVRRPRA